MKKVALSFIIVLCSIAINAAEKVEKRVLLYPSVDQYGDSVTLSGQLSVPKSKPAKGIILIPHFTISADKEAPSNKVTKEAKPFRDEYVILMPDYIGYGVTKNRIHPYLHGELTARNCVDMLLYAMPVLDSMKLSIPLDSIYIIGFSQGGASAMWILKLIEEQYCGQLHVKKCFAGSGPYDVATTYDYAVMHDRINMPLTVSMLVMGTNEAYGLNLCYDNIFTDHMKHTYIRDIKDKKNGIVSLYFKTPNHNLSHWMTKEGRDKNLPETNKMYRGFLRSSLVHYSITGDNDSICPHWIPKAPVYVFHSENDDIVTFLCAEHLHRRYSNLPNITWDFGRYGSHLSSLQKFFSRVKKMLNEECKSK